MVDVKLDMESTSSLTGRPPKKGGQGKTSCCAYFMWFLILGGIAFLALDAAEFISLGVVKDILGMKVLPTAEFATLQSSLANATALASKYEKTLKDQKAANGDTQQSLDKANNEKGVLTTQLEAAKAESAELTNALNVAKKSVDDEKAKAEGLTVKLAAAELALKDKEEASKAAKEEEASKAAKEEASKAAKEEASKAAKEEAAKEVKEEASKEVKGDDAKEENKE